MMKHLIIFTVCSISFVSTSQIVISQPEMLYFFKGYGNKIEATSQNGVKNIDLLSPDFTFTKEENGSYTAIATSNVGPAKIYMVDHKKHDTIQVFDVEIRQLPAPSLFLGGIDDSEIVADKAETRLFAKYGLEVPLNVTFSILKGEVILESGEKFAFTGNTLSSECHETLLKLADGSDITIIAEAIGPDGITRKINGSWRLETL